MTIKMNTRMIRPLVITLVAVLICTGMSPFGKLFAEEAYAAETQFDSSTGTGYVTDSTGTIGTTGRHIDKTTGAIAYCMDQGAAAPEGHVYHDYNPSVAEKSKLTAAMYYGYPRVTKIEGYDLTGDQARVVTQLVMWSIRGVSTGLSGMDFLNDLHPNNGNAAYQKVIDAAKALYTRASKGFEAATADISIPATQRGYAFSADFVRYGPYKAADATAVRANVTGAPSGYFLGNANGDKLNANNLPSGANFYLYIPANANMPNGSVRIKIFADYEVFAVYFWHTGTPQDMCEAGEPLSATEEATTTLLPFTNISIKKQDDETGKALSGANFAVQEWNGSSYQTNSSYTFSWNASSKVYTAGPVFETEINGGKFRIIETVKPYSYLSTWTHDFTVAGFGTTITRTANNTPVYLDVPLQKADRNMQTAVPQGDATLGGAVYGIYSAENRTHPDGTVYTVDQLVQTQTTDSKGQLTFGKLFPMNYYVKEISPSTGYLLDTTKYPVNGIHNGTADKVLVASSVTEQVRKQAFELIKIGTSEDETEVSLLNAGFKVYLISELTGVKDGSLKPSGTDWAWKDFKGYDFSKEATAMIDGVNTSEFFTDNLGHLVSPEFPYGKYVVIETTTPKGYKTINPFIVNIKDDSRKTQPWRIFDDKEVSFYIKVIKKDSETGNSILNKSAQYRIFDLDKNEYIKMNTTYPITTWHGTADNPFSTKADGTLITPEKLKYGNYRLDEVTAPEGYVLAGHEQTAQDGYDPEGHTKPNPSDPVYITFDNASPVYIADVEVDVLEVTQYNEQQKGKVNILKHAEMPSSVVTDFLGDIRFKYEDKPLSGIEFEIVADGDIVSQDGTGTVLHKSGDVVAAVTTDTDGKAWADNLYIGSYILRETKAPAGYLFVADEKFEIKMADQEKQFTFLAYGLTDIRQKLNVEIVKTEQGTDKFVLGATFGIYAAEDITFSAIEPAEKTYVGFPNIFDSGLLGITESGSVPRDTLVMKTVTDENGIAAFEDLPPGKYYVKEMESPKGYILNKDYCEEFTLSYDGNTKETIVWNGVAENIRQKLDIVIVKEDKETGKKLEGGEFTLYDKDGKKVQTAVTDKDGAAKFTDLPEGKYTVKETKAPDGYLINEDFHPAFKLKYDGSDTETLTWDGVCKESKTPAPETPKTGDDFNPIVYLVLIIGLGGLMGSLIYRIRVRRKSE